MNATGRAVALSGSSSVRTIWIDRNVRLVLKNLTLMDGLARGSDSIVLNGTGGSGIGGAVFNNHGTLEATDCVFRGNRALGGTGGPGVGTIAFNTGGGGSGGAIFNHAGTLMLTNVLFHGNAAQGGQGGMAGSQLPSRGGYGGLSYGGAIYSVTGIVTIANCCFRSNSAPASLPGSANGFNPSSGSASGGAIYSYVDALSISDSRFENQFCGGGEGLCTGVGGAIYQAGGTLSITACTFATNRVVGGNGIIIGIGGNSGSAHGGAISTASVAPPNQDDPPRLCVARITHSCFVGNEARGGDQAPAHSPAGGGYGGAVYNASHLDLLNCTLTANTASGGAIVFPSYPISSAYGGAIYTWYYRATSTLTHVTIARNEARVGTGAAGSSLGQGGGIFVGDGIMRIRNTILADNAPGANCFGTPLDEGGNLSSDASCAFAMPGSLNNANPLLLPLADYGGSTLTIALRADSPAIDAGNPAFCAATDQRGVSRSQNAACDIGAFETTLLSVRRNGNEGWLFEQFGVPNAPCTLQTSTNLEDWINVETSIADQAGRVQFARPHNVVNGNLFRTVFP